MEGTECCIRPNAIFLIKNAPLHINGNLLNKPKKTGTAFMKNINAVPVRYF